MYVNLKYYINILNNILNNINLIFYSYLIPISHEIH